MNSLRRNYSASQTPPLKRPRGGFFQPRVPEMAGVSVKPVTRNRIGRWLGHRPLMGSGRKPPQQGAPPELFLSGMIPPAVGFVPSGKRRDLAKGVLPGSGSLGVFGKCCLGTPSHRPQSPFRSARSCWFPSRTVSLVLSSCSLRRFSLAFSTEGRGKGGAQQGSPLDPGILARVGGRKLGLQGIASSYDVREKIHAGALAMLCPGSWSHVAPSTLHPPAQDRRDL